MVETTLNYPNLQSFSILYVEDDDDTREELEMILSSSVKHLYVANNGKDGLALFKQYRPDIVVTDIQMPVMNGLSMAADIKDIEPEQAIIVLSAHNDTEYLFRALEIGLQDYITKPVSVERLLDKLLKLVAQIALKAEFTHQNKLLKQYKLLLDESAIFARMDASGNIAYANRNFCVSTGYSAAELIGQNFLANFQPVEQENVLKNLDELLKDAHIWRGLVRMKTSTGTNAIFDLTLSVVATDMQEVENYLAFMVDLTGLYRKFERLDPTQKADLF